MCGKLYVNESIFSYSEFGARTHKLSAFLFTPDTSALEVNRVMKTAAILEMGAFPADCMLIWFYNLPHPVSYMLMLSWVPGVPCWTRNTGFQSIVEGSTDKLMWSCTPVLHTLMGNLPSYSTLQSAGQLLFPGIIMTADLCV